MGKHKKNADRDLEAATDPEAIFQMEAFWGTIKDIKDNTDRIDSQTQALSQLHAQTLECIDPMERAALAKQAETLADDITDLGTTNRLLIKNLTTENRNIAAEVGPSEPSMRIRTNQLELVSASFINALNMSQAAQNAFKEKARERLQRDYKLANPRATESELQRLVHSEGSSMMSQQIFTMDDRRLDAKRALEDMQERHQDIMNIERSILELHQLFVEMSALVEQQGELVSHIHSHIEDAVNYTEKAQVQMEKAVKSQKSRTKKKILLLVLLLLLAIGGALGIYFGLIYKRRNQTVEE